jgi:tRNA-specific 2-thiouridylase
MARNSLEIDKAPGDTRVVVAMSGGVDSSVTAALLKEQGYDVVGVTLQLYDQGVAAGKTGACCAGQDIADARQVADRLAIPHYVLDYESRFRVEVMESFADSYARGETPVPCIACNRTVKFRDLMKTARELGAEALATGHYVRRVVGEQGPELHRGAIRRATRTFPVQPTEQLDFLRFRSDPCQEQARALAERFDHRSPTSPTARLASCPTAAMPRWCRRHGPDGGERAAYRKQAGSSVHDGIVRFTVGSAAGCAGHPHGTDNDPLYVVRLGPTRRVVVGRARRWAEIALYI